MCEGDLAVEKATPTACKTPTLATCFPRWRRAPRREGVRKVSRQSLQVLTEAGIVHSGDGSRGLGGTGRCVYVCVLLRKHIHTQH